MLSCQLALSSTIKHLFKFFEEILIDVNLQAKFRKNRCIFYVIEKNIQKSCKFLYVRKVPRNVKMNKIWTNIKKVSSVGT